MRKKFWTSHIWCVCVFFPQRIMGNYASDAWVQATATFINSSDLLGWLQGLALSSHLYLKRHT